MNSSRLLFLFLVVSLSGCTLMKSGQQQTSLKKSLEKSEYFNQHFTGFALYDPLLDEYLYQWNANKYFNLASNTKLLTYYAGLKLLKDSLPGLEFKIRNDTLYFSGTGNPTFLNPSFKDQKVFDFLNNREEELVYVPSGFKDQKQADGWTWEDYQYYYQPERSGFPIYGNTISFVYDDLLGSFKVSPTFFDAYTEILTENKPGPRRDRNTNIFSYQPNPKKSNYKNRIPFITSDELTIALLEDTLKRKVHYCDTISTEHFSTLYSHPSDRLYRYMLKASDNLSAEHVHYMIAHERDWEMNSALVRAYLMNREFSSLPYPPIWKDGSGLSRYNLATPLFLIELLKKINEEISTEQMKSTFATGGVDGTIRKWYKPDGLEKPYVFGKTGTLSNNHNLTGILVTRSGRELFFSFMNNNYSSGSTPVKKEMEKVLRMVYEKF